MVKKGKNKNILEKVAVFQILKHDTLLQLKQAATNLTAKGHKNVCINEEKKHTQVVCIPTCITKDERTHWNYRPQ